MINIYSDTTQTALKYLKDTEANIHNVLIMAGNFGIIDSSWNLFFHSIHSNLLMDISDSLDLSLSISTNQVSTRYSDDVQNSNSVVNLMFFRPNSLELNNHTIYSDFCYLFDHIPLTVDIFIIKEFVPKKQHTIIKNSGE